MTAEGASSQSGRVGARPWQAVRRLVQPVPPCGPSCHGAPRSGRHGAGGDEFRRRRGVRQLPAEPGRRPVAQPGRSGAERPFCFFGGRSSHDVPPEQQRRGGALRQRAAGDRNRQLAKSQQQLRTRHTGQPVRDERELWSAVYRSGAVGRLQLACRHPAGAVQHRRRRDHAVRNPGRRPEPGQSRPDHGVPDQARRDCERSDPVRADDRRVRGGAGEPAAAGRNRGDRGRDRGRAPEPAYTRA